ncbi:MAG: hypothetical protein KAV87_59415 [Desulfobacteraceae bacterium]|nr:hypothetical protein [Desulfobacteraceae bacterium]
MTENTESTPENMTIKFGDLVFKTTKRYMKPIGPQNIISESDKRDAPDDEWTKCERLTDA